MKYLLYLVLFVVAICIAEPDYSWRMLGGNPQRNSRADWHSTLKNASVTWVFFAPSGGDQFIHSPVYSYPDGAVYSITFGGFIYSVNASTGDMNWETCVGTPPVFPNDPCTNLQRLTSLPYGQPTILPLSGDIVLLTLDGVGNGGDRMMRISKIDGSILWTWKLYVDEDSVHNDHFFSLPTPIPCNSTIANGTECVLIWTQASASYIYNIVDADRGTVVYQKIWPFKSAYLDLGPPPVIDPVDGNVISQYIDIIEECGTSYFDFMKCAGIGKFDINTGEKIWNQTMDVSWPNGMMTVDNGVIHVGGDQIYAYSYSSKNGAILWKVLESTATRDIFYPGVCSDGTVVYPDNNMYYQGWSSQVLRNKQPLFGVGLGVLPAIMPSMTNDGYFYSLEGNTMYVRSCKNGHDLYYVWLGAASGGSFTCPIAIGKDAIYANGMTQNQGAVFKLADNSEN